MVNPAGSFVLRKKSLDRHLNGSHKRLGTFLEEILAELAIFQEAREEILHHVTIFLQVFWEDSEYSPLYLSDFPWFGDAFCENVQDFMIEFYLWREFQVLKKWQQSLFYSPQILWHEDIKIGDLLYDVEALAHDYRCFLVLLLCCVDFYLDSFY